MSEELKMDDIADVIKSTVTETVEEKADKAELAELKEAVEKMEIPSTEGFIKEEAVEEKLAAISKSIEDLDAFVKAAPAVTKGAADMESEFFKWDGELELKGNNQNVNKTFIDVTKQFTSTTNITGAPTASQRLFYAMQQRNPFRGLSTMYPTSATSVNLPEVTGITAQAEANVPNSINTGTGHGGGISSVNVVPQNWTSRTAFSDQSVDDLPSLDMMISAFMGQQLAVAEAVDMIGQLDGNTNVSEVNTGVAAGLPTSIDPWADLIADLSSAYKPNARFMMSREALAHLRSTAQAGTGSDLIIDPSTGMFRFWGYEIVVNDHMDPGSVAGQNPVYFGDFSMGTTIVSRREMMISRHEDTIPGAMYYYGNMRSRGVVWDPNALVRFNVAA